MQDTGLRVIGLTGGIAAGKSTLAKQLRERWNIPVIDADVLGHQVYAKGSATLDLVVARFGRDVLASDGSVDRKVLGSRVFGKPEELHKLTEIVWPGIAVLATAEVQRLRAEGQRVVFLEAAVLLEAGWHTLCDEVWCVVADEAVAVARLCARNGLDEAAAKARIASQLTNAERVARSSVVLENNADAASFLAKANEAMVARGLVAKI